MWEEDFFSSSTSIGSTHYPLLRERLCSTNNIYIYILRSNPIKQPSKVLYLCVGVRRRESDQWALAHSPYFPQGNGRHSLRVEQWNKEDRPPDEEENPGRR